MFTHKLYLKVLVTYLAEVQAFYTNQSWSAYLLGLALRENTLGNKQFLKEFINHIQTENVADQDEISNATLYKLFSFLLRHKYTDDGDLLIDKFDKAIGWSVNDSWTSPIPQDMSYMVKYFETCNEENISTFPLFCQLMSLCKQPHGISNLDSVLYGMRRSKSIFTADNLILAIQYLKGNHRHELAWALDHMREYNLLPQDNPQLAQANFTLLLRNPARAGTEAANFRALFNFQLFNQANFEACMKH
ncbi:MAG TPA: hypothetical protein VHZ76_00305, partial [Gammaproteobacteria bacterium]|nr:hypothetical protein [Gammaproteobacteria bacterium]